MYPLFMGPYYNLMCTILQFRKTKSCFSFPIALRCILARRSENEGSFTTEDMKLSRSNIHAESSYHKDYLTLHCLSHDAIAVLFHHLLTRKLFFNARVLKIVSCASTMYYSKVYNTKT